MPKILLVNKNDKEIGFDDKLKVHKLGLFHRAFSIFIFDSKGRLLIQKRAKNKYHSGGLWSNTCCSHQKQNETLDIATHKRLKEEIGFDCELKPSFNFSYQVKFDNGLIENEFDHVFIGFCDKSPKINPKEASDCKYIFLSELKLDIKNNPQNYTDWLKIIMEKYFFKLKIGNE
jgi:isopentenyl-diphosphate delta-isomerase